MGGFVLTYEEFAAFWVREVYSAFPSLADWVAQVRPSIEERKATHQQWYKSLEDCTVEECRGVLGDWLRGEVVPFEAYSRDQASRVMRSCVMAKRQSERNRERTEAMHYEPESDKRPGISPVAPVLANAIKLSRSGASMSDVREYIEAAIPPCDPYDQPRYRCALCCDRGNVEVWRMDVAYRVDNGTLPLEKALGWYVVACTCTAGDLYADGEGRRSKLPRYSESNFCKRLHVDLESERESLRRWLEQRVASKRHAEFEAWAG